MGHEQRDVFTCDECGEEHDEGQGLPREMVAVQAVKGGTKTVLKMHVCVGCTKTVTVADVIEKGKE